MKKRKSPEKLKAMTDKNHCFSESVSEILQRYKHYTVSSVKRLTEELQNAVVSFDCDAHSSDGRIKELRRQLKHKAVLMEPHGANRHRGCFFVESVERESRAGCDDVVRISGVLYTPEVSEGMKNAFVRPINCYFGIDTTSVRDGSLRTTYGGEYYKFAICTKKVYEQYRSLARATLTDLVGRINFL